MVEQISLNVLHREVIGQTLNKHMFSYFNSDDAAAKICPKLLSTNSVLSKIDGFILRWTSEAFETE